ncbi:unnamed protein product [Microthlaspi erraticum]|uniref:RNase H type-1 domain-containing protein n=1 Tax=Microthlaspi erraticum TaxID=1685480 RepID=A0A6D2ID16_9BRAS|nr:unnamed protein product [Microthlaspi erraticum]
MAQQTKRKAATPASTQYRRIGQIPGREWLTCKSDAAWREDTKSAGFGWVISRGNSSNREEILHQGSDTHRFVRSPLSAEGLAVITALTRARDLGIKHLVVASNSQELIKAIKKESSTKELHGILHDILKLSLDFEKIEFVFIPREKNRQADALAKQALIVIEPV